MIIQEHLLFLLLTGSLLLQCFSFSPLSPTVRYHQQAKSSRFPLSMNLFQRFTKVVASNVNQIVSSLEDPEKILDQAVDDMQKDLVKIR